jgi:hypothetical protein
MARSHVYKVLQNTDGSILTGASVRVLIDDEDTEITGTIYADESSGSAIDQPFVSDTGLVEFWLATPQRVQIAYTPVGFSEQYVIVDAMPAPADIGNALFGGVWSADTTYIAGVMVIGSDNFPYISIASDNLDNDPTTDGGVNWTDTPSGGGEGNASFKGIYNSADTYSAGDLVVGSDNFLYVAKTDIDVDDDPTTDDGANWSVAPIAGSGAVIDTLTYQFAGETVPGDTPLTADGLNADTGDLFSIDGEVVTLLATGRYISSYWLDVDSGVGDGLTAGETIMFVIQSSDIPGVNISGTLTSNGDGNTPIDLAQITDAGHFTAGHSFTPVGFVAAATNAATGDPIDTSTWLFTLKITTVCYTPPSGENGVITSSTQTEDYTLVLGDAGTVVQMDMDSENTLTVPLNADVPYEIGTTLEIYEMGTGQTTIVAEDGVTIEAPLGAVSLANQFSSGTLRMRDVDIWALGGDLA